MATEKTTAKNATENRPTGTENAVNGVAQNSDGVRPSGAAGAVWDTLTANPVATVAAIAAVSGVSKAAVARTLTNLERDGRASRTPGGRDGGKRRPDTWTAITTDSTDAAQTPDAPSEEEVTEPEKGAADAPDGTAPTGAVPEGAGMDATAVAEARDALTTMGAAITAALEALDGGDGTGAMSAAEAVYSSSGRVRRLVRTAANGQPRNASGKPRSQPGEMRAKVVAHLSAHPGGAFTPHEIAKVIGHSAGAVSNALDRLAENGDAELVCERPRRFTTTRPDASAA